MGKLKIARRQLLTPDVDCMPSLLTYLTHPCHGVKPDVLEETMYKLRGRFQTVPSFWASVLYILGWSPEMRYVANYFRPDIRDAIVVCDNLATRCRREGAPPLTPSAALMLFLQETASEYSQAMSKLGVTVIVVPPEKIGRLDAHFADLLFRFQQNNNAPEYYCRVSKFDAEQQQLARLEIPGSLAYRRAKENVFAVEIIAPEDTGLITPQHLYQTV